MEKGAFIVSRHKEHRKEIQFNTTDTNPTNEQLKLKREVERSVIVLQNIFKNDEKNYELYFEQLLSLAQAGLVGDYANPEVARQALENFKYDIVVKMSGIIKNRYMKKLGYEAIKMMIYSFIFAAVSCTFNWPITNFIILWASCMPGVWLSFGARKTILAFENLHVLEEDRMEPIIRLIFAGLLTIIIGLIFSLGILKINLGGVSTELFNNDLRVVVLIGLLCGFSEQVLSGKVAKYANELFKS